MSESERPPHRQNDPPDFDPRGRRYWHGPPSPDEFANSSEVKAGWGDKSLTLRGPMSIIVVLLIALGGVFVYFQGVQSEGHSVLAHRMEMQTCVLSLTPEERVNLRSSLTGVHKLDTADFFIRSWCPWIGR